MVLRAAHLRRCPITLIENVSKLLTGECRPCVFSQSEPFKCTQKLGAELHHAHSCCSRGNILPATETPANTTAAVRHDRCLVEIHALFFSDLLRSPLHISPRLVTNPLSMVSPEPPQLEASQTPLLSFPSLPFPAQAAARGAGDGDAHSGDGPNKHEGARRLAAARELNLSDAEEQIPGQPWNYQQKFDPRLFAKTSEWAPSLYALPDDGVCDL